MSEKTLMFVRAVWSDSVELASYKGALGAIVPVNAPPEVIRSMLGRQCWVTGAVGDECKIVLWAPLPSYEDHKENKG